MPRAVLTPLAITLFVLGTSTQTALAGPVPWSYEIEISGPFASFGVVDQVWFDPVTGSGGTTSYHLLGRVESALGGNASGPRSIPVRTLGHADLQLYPVDDPWALNQPSRFAVRVSITDTPSGESRTVEFGGTGSNAGILLNGAIEVNLALDDRTEAFVLGENRYSVSPRVEDSASEARVLLDVGVVHANPEPGTLTLVGIGLCGTGAIRRLRRSRPAAG